MKRIILVLMLSLSLMSTLSATIKPHSYFKMSEEKEALISSFDTSHSGRTDRFG